MHEHRGTLICTAVLHELRPTLEANANQDRPRATGGNPEGDHSLVASLLIQMMLLDAGWDATNLGPNTPMASFRVALGELEPRLIWLSASHLPDRHELLGQYCQFYHYAVQAGVAVAVGGQAIDVGLRSIMPATFHGTCLTELEAFARTLHARPRPPTRGRPRRRGT
jgi:methanogenic corrinoid protein MtbC1